MNMRLTAFSAAIDLEHDCACPFSPPPLPPRRSPLRAQQQVTLYNFGSPRVGNRPFVELFNAEIPDSWRVTNDSDIVTTVPRVLGWAHVRHRVKVDSDGYMRVQAAAGEDVFGEGRLGFIRGLKRVLRDEVRGWWCGRCCVTTEGSREAYTSTSPACLPCLLRNSGRLV